MKQSHVDVQPFPFDIDLPELLEPPNIRRRPSAELEGQQLALERITEVALILLTSAQPHTRARMIEELDAMNSRPLNIWADRENPIRQDIQRGFNSVTSTIRDVLQRSLEPYGHQYKLPSQELPPCPNTPAGESTPFSP